MNYLIDSLSAELRELTALIVSEYLCTQLAGRPPGLSQSMQASIESRLAHVQEQLLRASNFQYLRTQALMVRLLEEYQTLDTLWPMDQPGPRTPPSGWSW